MEFKHSVEKPHLFANYIVCHFGATYMDGMTGDPLFILDILRGPFNQSIRKVWWYSYSGLFSKWPYCFICEICKFSATLRPPMWTGWLLTPISFYIKGDLMMIAEAKINGVLTILGYFKMEIKFWVSLSPSKIPYYVLKGQPGPTDSKHFKGQFLEI